MRNQDKIELNELNKNSNGGTELTTRGLYHHLDEEDLDGVQIITSRVRELDPNRIRILHLHDLAEDPESAHLANGGWKKFHGIVFCSHWQRAQFIQKLGIPATVNHETILNGFEPFYNTRKDFVGVHAGQEPIRLIYTSTPHRGLNILYEAVNRLSQTWGSGFHLDVYSSFGLYGWPEMDAQFEPLFEACRNHPNITYHGWVPNEEVRAAYEKAHIFAYPSTWQETSCLCLIEAMSSMCLAVHSSLAALPETSSGLTVMYDYVENQYDHLDMFTNALHNTMMGLLQVPPLETESYLRRIKSVADIKHSWNISVAAKWKSFISYLKEQGLDKSVLE